MNNYKLLLNKQTFFDDFIYTLKILALNMGQADSSDVLIFLPYKSNPKLDIEEKLYKCFEKEGMKASILHFSSNHKISEKCRYLFVFSDEKNRIKKMSVSTCLPGLTLIYTAQFPCPNKLKKIPYFNAAASASKNYGLT